MKHILNTWFNNQKFNFIQKHVLMFMLFVPLQKKRHLNNKDLYIWDKPLNYSETNGTRIKMLVLFEYVLPPLFLFLFYVFLTSCKLYMYFIQLWHCFLLHFTHIRRYMWNGIAYEKHHVKKRTLLFKPVQPLCVCSSKDKPDCVACQCCFKRLL